MAADDKRGGGLYDVEPRRSIFAALWFRVILVLIVVGVIGALAVPYVLDVVNPPGVKPAVVPKATATPVAPARGAYWVQVGAFKDLESAKRLAARLRDQNYPVEESSTGGPTRHNPGNTPAAPPGGDVGSDKYDVFVGGAALADVTAKLSAKGLTTEPARDGVVVRPSLPLRDAVALSKDLAAMGLKVQVRRSGAAASPASTPAANPGGDGLHRVRVGPYPDRAAATSALKELEATGYNPFLARR